MTYSIWGEQVPCLHPGDQENSPTLVPFFAEGSASKAAVIVCPGGGYHHRANHEGDPIACWLNSLGISAFVLHYRTAPYQHPVPLADAQRAIRFVRFHAKEWNLDKEKIGILGFSAGGHLAASVSTLSQLRTTDREDVIELESARPDLAVLCYPVISFLEHYHEGSMVNLLGENPSQELRMLLSCEQNVSTDTPQTFLWHTAADASVPVENSLSYAAALSKVNVPYEMHIFPHGRHGLGLASEDPVVGQWTNLCPSWLAQQRFC
ncbi:alpha/beta hydrolase [Neobacillus dielmonensis]|uniref:alpha/beta hydrolase n=1 Tax=Neobacillus dielmonensis TaxID=1347369 RepID=UPI0005A9D89B|nr:alpha/beta hydrolase [Neobacillus dielmonensis]